MQLSTSSTSWIEIETENTGIATQQIVTCSKLTIETLKKGVKNMFKDNDKDTTTSFYCRLWTGKRLLRRFKLLSNHISRRVDFNNHLSQICQKACKKLSVLTKLCKYIHWINILRNRKPFFSSKNLDFLSHLKTKLQNHN